MLLHPLDADGGRTGGYRAVFGGPEQATIERATPVTEDEVTRALTAVHGPDTVLRRLRWGTRFSDASRQLTDYRHGPVLFAGDAAHIHPPIGGQGLNLGVQDAMNLGWKLAATLRGRVAGGLLDSYHAERHPVAARVLASTRAQGVLMSPPPEADDVRALREIVIELARLPDTNRYLAGLMSGLDIRYDLGDPRPLVGARMLDLALRVADRDTTVSALLRTGRGLLLELGTAPAPAVREADRPMAGAVGSGVERVVARVVDSPVGTELGVDRVLVRPDGYVCWVGTGAGPVPAAVLHRWFGPGAPTDLKPAPASVPIAG
jgi:hypothetical protein